MKTLLYLHGLGGMGDLEEHNDYWENLGIQFISPTLSYHHLQNNPMIFPLLDELVKNVSPDGIIGNSMGGFLAYHLGRTHGIKTLLFNPALSNRTLSHRFFNSVIPTKHAEDTEIHVAYSTFDDVVDIEQTRKYLQQQKGNTLNEFTDQSVHKHGFGLDQMLLNIFKTYEVKKRTQ